MRCVAAYHVKPLLVPLHHPVGVEAREHRGHLLHHVPQPVDHHAGEARQLLPVLEHHPPDLLGVVPGGRVPGRGNELRYELPVNRLSAVTPDRPPPHEELTGLLLADGQLFPQGNALFRAARSCGRGRRAGRPPRSGRMLMQSSSASAVGTRERVRPGPLDYSERGTRRRIRRLFCISFRRS